MAAKSNAEHLLDEINRVNAEVMVVQSLLFGLCQSLKAKGIGADVLKEAFDIAEDTAVSSSLAGDKNLAHLGTMKLDILERLRKAYL